MAYLLIYRTTSQALYTEFKGHNSQGLGFLIQFIAVNLKHDF